VIIIVSNNERSSDGPSNWTEGVFKIESSRHTRAFRSKIKCPNKNGTINYMYHITRYVRDSNTSACSSGSFPKQAKGPLISDIYDTAMILTH